MFPDRRLSFTGSRDGMTIQQRLWLCDFVAERPPEEAAHGDCIGADAEFHAIIRQCAPECRISVWPSTYEKMRAFCEADIMHEPMQARKRDQLIVDFATDFVGCPPTNREISRSGSWMTLRMAKKRVEELGGLYVVCPDGVIMTGARLIREAPCDWD